MYKSKPGIMRLIIRDDAEASAVHVADYIVRRIKDFNPTADRPFVLGLPTGSSPMGVYEKLVKMYKAGEVCHSPNGLTPPLTEVLIRP